MVDGTLQCLEIYLVMLIVALHAVISELKNSISLIVCNGLVQKTQLIFMGLYFSKAGSF